MSEDKKIETKWKVGSERFDRVHHIPKENKEIHTISKKKEMEQRIRSLERRSISWGRPVLAGKEA
jgi:hypothetical protein